MEAGVNAMQTVSAIRQLWTEAGQYQEAYNASVKIALAKTNQLSASIQAGEAGTGDLFTDFVLVACGAVGEKHVEKLRELEKRVKDHTGELLLIVQCEPGRTDVLSESDDILIVTFYLGLLQEDELIVDPTRPSCLFPTSTWAEIHLGNKSKGLLFRGNLGFSKSSVGLNFLDLDQPMGMRERYRNHWNPFPKPTQLYDRMKLEVAIGDKEVYQWFVDRNLEDVFGVLGLTLSHGKPIS